MPEALGDKETQFQEKSADTDYLTWDNLPMAIIGGGEDITFVY